MFQVKANKCDQCLFSNNKIVSDKRKQNILESCKTDDSYFICHKSTMDDGRHCCKGFYDSQDSQMIQIAKRLNMVEFVA